MKEDFHEHLEHYKLCTVRSVVTKSIDKHSWGPSGHECHLPGLVRPLSPHSDGDRWAGRNPNFPLTLHPGLSPRDSVFSSVHDSETPPPSSWGGKGWGDLLTCLLASGNPLALELRTLSQRTTLPDHGDKQGTHWATSSPYFLPHKMGHGIMASKALQ